MKRDWHYYEAHINLGKMDKTLEIVLPEVLKGIDFKTTDIVALPIKGLESEDFYKIITTKDTNLETMKLRVSSAVEQLIDMGYDVQRYKIESTIIDSKYEDFFNLLTKQ